MLFFCRYDIINEIVLLNDEGTRISCTEIRIEPEDTETIRQLLYMTEESMNEDSNLLSGEYNIRFSGQFGIIFPVSDSLFP